MNVTFRTQEGPFRLRGIKIAGPNAEAQRRVQAFFDSAYEAGMGPHDNRGSLAANAIIRAGFKIIHFEVEGEPDAAGADVRMRNAADWED